ncbi:MAG: hypothetical protein KDB27_07510, partial [Planctomycetales bacterium]|nr:hypothetical protein [Planctomycetales bacterium]
WSVVLLVLVFWLLRRQTSQVHRAWLCLLSAAIVVPALLATAVAIHNETDHLLWAYYVRPSGSELFPALMLSTAPLGMALGALIAWYGVLRHRKTGHLRAQHWNWWCCIWSAFLFMLGGVCLIANDFELRWRRDALLARADSLEQTILELTSTGDVEFGTKYKRQLDEVKRFHRNVRQGNFSFDLQSVEMQRVARWDNEAKRVFVPFNQLIDSGDWKELQTIPPSEIIELAESYYANAEYLACRGDVVDAIADLRRGTSLIDRAIVAEDNAQLWYEGYEWTRALSLQRILNVADKSHAGLLNDLITDRPYTHLPSRKGTTLQTEIDKVRIVKNVLRGFDFYEPLNDDTFINRFLALRRLLAAAQAELPSRTPTKADVTIVRPSEFASEAQFRRLFANSMIRARTQQLNGSAEPGSEEVFAEFLNKEEIQHAGITTFENNVVLWIADDKVNQFTPIRRTELLMFTRRRESIVLGPLYRFLAEGELERDRLRASRVEEEVQ